RLFRLPFYRAWVLLCCIRCARCTGVGYSGLSFRLKGTFQYGDLKSATLITSFVLQRPRLGEILAGRDWITGSVDAGAHPVEVGKVITLPGSACLDCVRPVIGRHADWRRRTRALDRHKIPPHIPGARGFPRRLRPRHVLKAPLPLARLRVKPLRLTTSPHRSCSDPLRYST